MKTTTRVLLCAAVALAAWQVVRRLDERARQRAGWSVEGSRARDSKAYHRAIARWENEGGATRASRARSASITG
jgi:hypothetical protein